MGMTKRGLEVSTDDADAVAALDVFTDRLAGIEVGTEAIVEDVARWPDDPSLRLAAASLFLYGQTAETDVEAHRHLEAAAALEPRMNERERATLAAMRAWGAGEFLVAVETHEALVRQWPTDLLALKALEFLYYVLGQQHNGERFLATVEQITDPNKGDADFLAVWAFANELSGHADRAIDLAEQSVAIKEQTPWAHHALAHALITKGDPPAAIDRLEAFVPVWEASARFIHCHNAWHLAVAHLDRLDHAAATAVFRDQIWGVLPDTPGEQIDAISLLWRLDMAGAPAHDDAWADIAAHVVPRVTECVFPFLSAHQAYALARAGERDALATLLQTVATRSEANDDEAVRVWRPVGRAVVEASAAHGAGDRARAAALLDPVMPMVTAVGGSDAQDDLFRQAYFTGLVAAGRHADAATYWQQMTAWKTTSPLDEHLRATA